MRVLFLTLYPERAASARYRVGQFIPYLRAHGIECTVAPAVTEAQYATLTGPTRTARPFWYHVAETRRRLRQILTARRYDVVFLQKAVMTAFVRGADTLVRGFSRRLVYDVDDAVHLAPPHPLRGPWRSFEDQRQPHKLFALADCVLAGNAWLASVASAAGARVELFPTVVDTTRFTPPPEPPSGYRIGWIGGPSTTGCLAPILEVLRSVRDADIRVVGADWSEREFGPTTANFEIVPWSLETEVAEVQGFSVGIMPLLNDEWTRGKCALKSLQYMACGVPCVATPFGAVLDIIRHDENGLFADSASEWEAALERLRDPALRRRLGQAGRATVEAAYSLAAAAPKLRNLLESLA